MFPCKKCRLLAPLPLLFFPKPCPKPPFWTVSLQTIERLRFFSTQCPSSTPPYSMKLLLDNVALGTGCLEDMESSLEKMNIRVSSDLVTEVIRSCKTLPFSTRSRRLLRFFIWSLRRSSEALGDGVFNCAIRAFAEMKDLTAMGISISELQRKGCRMDDETFAMASEALIKAGKPDEAIFLLRSMGEKPTFFVLSIVQSLCNKGHARKAEGVVWHHHMEEMKEEEKEVICQSLLHGWCIHGNAKEARKALEKMKSLGINPGLASYNDYLLCICDRNVRFNPSGLVSQATEIMMEMRSFRVIPTSASFNILLRCLSRARRVKEACEILSSMMEGEVESSPDQVTYYVVIRLLYLTKKIGKGNGILSQMIENGMEVEARFLHGLIGVLCGIENIKCALEVFQNMKGRCKMDTGPTYDLLIEKLCRNGEFDVGSRLYDEAMENEVVLRISKELLNPSKTQVFKRTRSQEKLLLGKNKSKVLGNRRTFFARLRNM